MWLSVKSQIYRLQPLTLQTRPRNSVRGLAYDITTHNGYKIVQGILFLGFLISMSTFTTNMNPQQRKVLVYVQYAFVIILIIEYILEFLAFGIRPQYKRSFIFKNIVLIYCTVYVIVDLTTTMNTNTERVLGGISIALQFFRYLSRKILFKFSP